MRSPSGEKYAQDRKSAVDVTIFCLRFPSGSQVYRLEPRENTNRLPSGDHAAQIASKSPILCGEPEGSGCAQIGVSPESLVPTRSWERSGLMSMTAAFLITVGTIEASPPFTDIWAITEPLGAGSVK